MTTSSLKGFVYLNSEQYTELVANGQITVNGVTIPYNRDAIYITEDDAEEEGAVIDLSAYYTKTEVDTKLSEYVSFISDPIYVHYIHIYTTDSSTDSCNCYATIYSTSSTKLTETDLINTYNVSNKLYNITGIVSNSNGTTAVGNVFFASETEASFNDATQTCTGATINVEDTVLGRIV